MHDESIPVGICQCGCGGATPPRKGHSKPSRGHVMGEPLPFISGHWHTSQRRPLAERFWENVVKTDSCWLWQGTTKENGYGVLNRGRRGQGMVYAHRVAYELLVGPIPEGLDIDHVRERGCVHHHCVNPAHLEPVTHAENCRRGVGFSGINARKTHCKHGHPFDERNTRIDADGRRACRACGRARYHAKKAAT